MALSKKQSKVTDREILKAIQSKVQYSEDKLQEKLDYNKNIFFKRSTGPPDWKKRH